MRRSVLFPIVFWSFCLCLFAVISCPAAMPDEESAPEDYSIGDDFVGDDSMLSDSMKNDETETEDPSYENLSYHDLPASDSGTDAVFVIDVSGSMKQSDPDYLCRSAAMNCMEDLSLTPGSRAALITFSDTLNTVIPLTDLEPFSDENVLVQELNSLSYTAGDTDIGTALEKAASLLTEADSSRAKCIFLLTDGEIDLPAAPDEEAAEKESLTRALVAVEEAKTEGIVIHTVALDLSGSMDMNLLHYLADSTGGTANLVDRASALNDVFRALSAYAARLRPAAETEAETESEEMTEMETETETETEQQAAPAVFTIGSIDGPVHLDGLFPNLCSAKLKLSDLFRLEGETSGFPDAIRYTAYSDDSDLIRCTVEGDELTITGLKNGTARIQVIAEPSADDVLADSVSGNTQYSGTGSGSDSILYYGGNSDYEEDDGNGSSRMNQAQLSFTVEVDALIPSYLYLLVIPGIALIAGVLIWFLRNGKTPAGQLSGSLQWYVRGENEKIFGMPGQTLADLADYGNRVRLSELVRDDLLSGAPIDKVVITPGEEGIVIASRSSSCLIAGAGYEPARRLEMTGSGRFKVLCETDRGKAAVIAMYLSGSGYKTEPSCEDDSDERTRLLV